MFSRLQKGGEKMKFTTGIDNETNFVNALDGKLFKELNRNLQFFLLYLFPNMDKSMKFHCYKTENFIKPDIVIYQGQEYRYVSLKYGSADTLHNENIRTFIQFLRECGISKETLKTYLLYHYGDGTLNGTGQRRMNSVTVRYMYETQIKKMNEEFNQSKDFIKKVAERVMAQGVNLQAAEAQYIYHGDPEGGTFISIDSFMKHVDKKDWHYMEKCVHIGPFVLRPHARYAGKKIENEDRRNTVTVTYSNFVNEMIYIQSHYDFTYERKK